MWISVHYMYVCNIPCSTANSSCRCTSSSTEQQQRNNVCNWLSYVFSDENISLTLYEQFMVILRAILVVPYRPTDREILCRRILMYLIVGHFKLRLLLLLLLRCTTCTHSIVLIYSQMLNYQRRGGCPLYSIRIVLFVALINGPKYGYTL